MQLKIYSIRDSKGEVFNNPFLKLTHGEAERDFTQVVRDPKTTINAFPEDYDLWYLGTFDNVTGRFETLETPQHVTKAINVMSRKHDPSLTQIDSAL